MIFFTETQRKAGYSVYPVIFISDRFCLNMGKDVSFMGQFVSLYLANN